uniref:Glycosyltransferase 28 domain protein n=1 Tax=Cyanothece sp. (strain PCC 7425 / ATCC 29141) TaxID=395961 RepID=B8HQ78_CYAP4
MIIVTLGTQFFPFNRAVDWLQTLLEEGLIRESVLLQHGQTSVSRLDHPLVHKVSSLKPEEMHKAVQQSSLVISHAGQGSARMLARLGAQFVLLPRLKQFGEHVDDHQLWFAQAIARLGVCYCTEYADLVDWVRQPPPPFQGELFPSPSLAEYLAGRFSSTPTWSKQPLTSV